MTRHERTIHVDRRESLEVSAPSPTIDNKERRATAGSSTYHASQFVEAPRDIDIYSMEVQAPESGSISQLVFESEALSTFNQTPESFPDDAIDPALDLLQPWTRHDAPTAALHQYLQSPLEMDDTSRHTVQWYQC